MNAAEIMTPDPMTVKPSARVRDAIDILQTLEIRHLPVVGDGGALIGMVSDRDLRMVELDRAIIDIMSSDVVKIGPETEVREVIDLMLENKVGALPVVDDATGDLMGIVSYVDVLRSLRGELD